MIKSPNQNFLRFPHSSIHLSHIPKCTFVPYISTKSQIHFFSSLPPGGSKTFRTIAPKSRCQHGPLFAKRVGLLASIIPGGSWWALPELREDGVEPTTALIALRRIWELVADERWAAFVAVGSLVIAALSEISIPSILAASIFSAQSGETVAFSRNALFLLLLCLTSGICSGLRSGCFGILNVTLVKHLRENLYATILFQDISYFDKERVGDLTSRLTADCQRLSHVIGNDLQLILRNTCQVALETLSSIRTVRAYGTRKREFGRYKQWLQSLAVVTLRENMASGFWDLIFSSLYRFMQIFAVLLVGLSVLRNACSRTLGLLHRGKSSRCHCKISLNLLRLNVCDAKVLTEQPYLAKVGLSGSGKSTLLNLLLRLYEPSSGQIYIDGFPLKELDIRWLRQNISYVAQESHLFHMDIKSNIKYGCPGNIKQEDIERAAKKAYAHDFISSLPNGYETLVDDNALSGGQKQRIALARAILRDPVIMILDEATSALDSESEHYIQESLYALKDESKTRTIIIIAHRLSTAKAADKIFVMDDGGIIEVISS
ncbi:hypothetical protein LR48_Vigan03g160900 [Vigna angularis]|uniref:ABC transporter domain-containing protein n=1 Tax=Phaseolus angularis TaxID=3914 RepID=A0A0L9U6D4_PHAAN|nr:hypothetical protein LR48_Vigan03g160900 [Vigna angularis]